MKAPRWLRALIGEKVVPLRVRESKQLIMFATVEPKPGGGYVRTVQATYEPLRKDERKAD